MHAGRLPTVHQYREAFVPDSPLRTPAAKPSPGPSHGAPRLHPAEQILLAGVSDPNPIPSGQARSLMALQRVAGNRAVLQLVRMNRAAPTVQRCGLGGCADSAERQEAEAPAPAQVVEGQEEEARDTPSQEVVQRAPAEPAWPRLVQRVATFTAGPVHQVNNLAGCVVNGTPVGVTWPTLNGTQFWSVAAAQGALVRPTITTSAAAAGGFDSVVATVPANTASYDETVLAAGPWRLVTPKATIAAMLPALAACAVAGDTRFRAYGKPSDTHMFTANRRHEDHHANDHRAAFRATIKAWDRRLTRALARGRRFHGASAAEAEGALWTAMGGTPDQVAEAFMNQAQAAVIAYHGSAAGGPVGAPTNPGSRNNCDITWAKYRNPS